ncbi:excisionase family DNA-binding protein [Streptomyces sp. NPDC040750]|uniref:excisionase family DNA-binding protein n=1 Tax=Streptomyces sp. NPDC040750 TaxID=3154491 RepID=UPI00340F4DF5
MADQLLDVKQVAIRLGTWEESGERFPRRLIEERRIAYVKVGRYVRIRESAVEAFIEANTVHPRRSDLRRAA